MHRLKYQYIIMSRIQDMDIIKLDLENCWLTIFLSSYGFYCLFSRRTSIYVVIKNLELKDINNQRQYLTLPDAVNHYT